MSEQQSLPDMAPDHRCEWTGLDAESHDAMIAQGYRCYDATAPVKFRASCIECPAKRKTAAEKWIQLKEWDDFLADVFVACSWKCAAVYCAKKGEMS